MKQKQFFVLVLLVIAVSIALLFGLQSRNTLVSSKFGLQSREAHVSSKQYAIQYPEYLERNASKQHRSRDISFDYKSAMQVLNEARVDQEDPRLIQLIRDYYIDPPSDLEYNLTEPGVEDKSQGQSKYIDSQLHSMEGGFFVECGALTGDRLSNTFYFEKARKWEGLLIEANSNFYAKLRTKHRKAYSINACLSTKPYPNMVAFNGWEVMEGQKLTKFLAKNGDKTAESLLVQCFPLTSILLALGRTKVDYFSLDIEGDELKVLTTVPMHTIDITTMSVEVTDNTVEEKMLTSYLGNHGYKKLKHILATYARDNIYIKKDFKY